MVMPIEDCVFCERVRHYSHANRVLKPVEVSERQNRQLFAEYVPVWALFAGV